MPEKRVLIIGAGLAGLSCAVRLQELGISFWILEKSDQVGGRVATYQEDGFLLDRGFQVLLTAYPRTSRLLDYPALELKAFYPGARIRRDGRFHTLTDPLRRPIDALTTAMSAIGTLSDKRNVLKLRNSVMRGSVAEIIARPETTTEQRLKDYGFSRNMIDIFFRPFLGGIFLEPNLATSSRKFEFVMRMFSGGFAALPRRGMSAIPQQLARKFPAESIRLHAPVESIHADGVRLESGEHVPGRIVVVATSEPEAARLESNAKATRGAGVTCLYYSAARPPIRGPWLVLNGEGTGPINNLCVPSELHRSYAPAGRSLISVTVLGVKDDAHLLEQEVRKQLADWFGGRVIEWQHLRTFVIPDALALQEPPALQVVKKPLKLSENLFACGDYLSITSIEGAISTGVRCADQIKKS